MSKIYTFITNNNEQINQPKKITYYYQIASYPNDKLNNKFMVRKFKLVDQQFESKKDYFLTKYQLTEFVKKLKHNEYKIYPCSNLDLAGNPKPADISVCESELLCDTKRNGSNMIYGGYAPF